MADANVAVTFSANADDFVGAVSAARAALEQFRTPFADLSKQFGELRGSVQSAFDPGSLKSFDGALGATKSLQQSLAADHAQAAQAMRGQDQAAYQDAVGAAKLAIAENKSALEAALRERISGYADDAKHQRISEGQKVAASMQAYDEVAAAEADLIRLEASLGQQSLTARQSLQNQLAEAERHHQAQITTIGREGENARLQEYESYGGKVTNAFNSQLNGLLRGTTNWRDAFKNMLQSMLVEFIHWVEQSVTRFVAGEAMKTNAAVLGANARVGADTAASGAGAAAHAAAILPSIYSSAAETFAGVFGFLSPILGPAAAGPAVAAQATVLGAAGAVASADIGMWKAPQDMLTLIHHNELIMPAAEAGSFRDLLSNGGGGGTKDAAVHIHPTTNFHVSAVDSGSVAQWMKGNSATMMRAIDEAVRHGAHLGMRRLSF